jgi:outer membrane lipoprotein SlyB
MVFTVVLSGCESINFDDIKRTKVEGALVGCAVGAIAGKVLDASNRQLIASCIAGVIAGLSYGDHIAGKKERYAAKETYYRDVIKEADKVAIESRALSRNLDAEIKLLQSKERNILAKSAQEREKKAELAVLSSQASRSLKRANSGIKKVEREIAIQLKVRKDEGQSASAFFIKASDSKLTALEQQSRQLRLAKAQLKALDNRRFF